MIDTSKSSSYEQQKAEIYIASTVEEWLGCPVERNVKVILSDGVHIEPDLYSEKDRVICEIFAHIGTLKVGQQHKISQDILKMLLLERSKNTTYRKVIEIADADGYHVTIYQQQNGNWVDTGFGYDLDKDTTAVDMALTVGGEETEETKNLTVNQTYKVGVSAYREPEDGAKYYSAETESSGVLLPEYTPLNLALSVNGTACATDENGVYHAYVGGSSNSLAVTCAEAEIITVTRMDTDARLAPGEANTFAIPDFTGTLMLRVNGVKGMDVTSAFLLVSRDTTAPVLTLSAPLSTRTGLREPIKLPARRMPEAKSFTEKQRKRLCRRRRQLCGARSAGWRFRDFQKEAPQINSA